MGRKQTLKEILSNIPEVKWLVSFRASHSIHVPCLYSFFSALCPKSCNVKASLTQSKSQRSYSHVKGLQDMHAPHPYHLTSHFLLIILPLLQLTGLLVFFRCAFQIHQDLYSGYSLQPYCICLCSLGSAGSNSCSSEPSFLRCYSLRYAHNLLLHLLQVLAPMPKSQ